MAFDGTDPCWQPDVPISRPEKWRMDIAQYGDGYAQRILDGINALDRKWSLTWELREAAVVNAMVAYFEARKGNSFQFKEPGTNITYDVWADEWQVDWVLKRWNRANPAAPVPVYYGTLSAEFVRAYGVTG